MPPWQFIEAVIGASSGDGAIVPTHKIEKTGGVAGTWDAGASSVQSIAGDGFVEFSVTGKLSDARVCGLGATDTAAHLNDVDYGWLLSGGNAEVRENGVPRLNDGVLVAGDVFRVQRIGQTVYYFRNGELRYTAGAASVGAVFVDTALWSGATTLEGIRLYDAATKSWPALTWQGVTNVTMTAGELHRTRRMTFAAPSKMRVGDQLIVLLVSQGAEQVSSTSVAWAFADAFTSATNKRGCAVYRRIVTDSEPAEYTFDLNVHQETLGALLVYRGLDNAAEWVGGSGIDTSAATVHPCPSRTLTRYSDLYLGVILQRPSVGGMSIPADCASRVEFFQNELGWAQSRLKVFDFAAEAVGATDTKRGTDAAASSCMAASIALQGLPALGYGLSWSPAALGAIGLPVEGI